MSEELTQASHRADQAARSINGAVGNIEESVRKLEFMLGQGYGGPGLQLIELLEKYENHTKTFHTGGDTAPYIDLIGEILLLTFDLQEFLWDDESYMNIEHFDLNNWVPLFQKRVDKIAAIDSNTPNWKVEVRKRLLQQAALSIKCIVALKEQK